MRVLFHVSVLMKYRSEFTLVKVLRIAYNLPSLSMAMATQLLKPVCIPLTATVVPSFMLTEYKTPRRKPYMTFFTGS